MNTISTEPGETSVEITVIDDEGAETQVMSGVTVRNVAPTLSNMRSTITASEGEIVELVSTVVDSANIRSLLGPTDQFGNLTIGGQESGLVAAWQFQGSATDSYPDLAGNGHNVVAGEDAPQPLATLGMLFNGQQGLDVPGFTGITGTAERTVSALIRSGQDKDQTIVSWGDDGPGQGFFFGTVGGRLRLDVGDGHVIGTQNIADDDTHQVAVSFTGDELGNVLEARLYVDGELDGFSSVQGQGILTSDRGPFTIGNDPLGRGFEGFIRELQIWDTGLREADELTYQWSVEQNGQDVTETVGEGERDQSIFRFEPTQPGTYVVTHTVQDEHHEIATSPTEVSHSITVEVENVDPTAFIVMSRDSRGVAVAGDEIYVPTNAPVSLESRVEDPGNDTLSYDWKTTGPTASIPRGVNGNYTFTPTVAGPHTVTLSVRDANGGAAETTTTVHALPRPQAIADAASVQAAAAIIIDVLGNDVDVNEAELFVRSVGGNDFEGDVSLTEDRKAIIYQPRGVGPRTDTLVYTARDGLGVESLSGTITVSVGAGSTLLGDFTGDGLLSVADINAMQRQLTLGFQQQFDLVQDGRLDGADVTHWVESIFNTLPGDTNLDRQVDFADFLILAANFGRTDASWASADFDLDGTVSFADFLALSNNFGRSTAAQSRLIDSLFEDSKEDWL